MTKSRPTRATRPLFALLLALAVTPYPSVLAAPASDQEGKATIEQADDSVKAPIEEQAHSSKGNVTVEGRRIDYTVTPGTLTLRNDKGEPIASMFYVAYVVDNGKAAPRRPVTFVFNGGPGSSSMWLHMGSFGPVRVDTPTDKAHPPAPFRIAANPQSIIDKTDLVFLDAIGTGLSRPVGKAKGTDFWGVDQDINAFASGIQRYLTINNRWNSPKILLGESYGTLRAAGLVNELQNRGVEMNGVILLSSILNYGIRNPGYDRISVTYLPSYAATAWYHNRLPNRPASLEPFLTEVRAFANGPYLTALAKGDDLNETERENIARQMSAYTGLSPDYLLRNDLRVDLGRFRKELMRDQGRTVGRLDSRFLGIDMDEAGEQPEFDAADTAISGAYIAAINDYLFGTLGYKTDLQYRPNFYKEISPNWDQKHISPINGGGRKMPAADTALDLARAMRVNPHLKVLSLNGYYDMATPFFGAEYDLKHMQLDPSLRGNLTFRYYESGHMIYIHPESMTALRRDLSEFYATAAP
ncbi:MAG: peptidase S10 [Sphingomonadales bacterium]|nr:MAG: peptidase S10 [Sphingomonadales bacterium]TNF03843.1 MAG: peptidase S10 [Sphingomonadales bacterium]